MSSNACTLGRAALLAGDTGRALKSADAVVALSVLACGGSMATFDPRVHAARPFGGPAISASVSAGIVGDGLPGTGARLQDPYGLQLRAAAQRRRSGLPGPDVEIVELDMNAAMENPLIAGRSATAHTPARMGSTWPSRTGTFSSVTWPARSISCASPLPVWVSGPWRVLSLLCDPAMTGVTRFLTDGTPAPRA